MLSKEQAQALIQKVASSTKYYATVSIYQSEQGVTRFANSEISQNVTITNGSATITLYDGKKRVTCTTNALLESGMEQLVQDAESMLAFVPEGEFAPFPFSTEPIPSRDSSGILAQNFGPIQRAQYIKDGMVLLSDGFTASGALTLSSAVYALGDSNGGFRYAHFQRVDFNTVVTHESGADGAGECMSYTTPPDILAHFKKAQATAQAAINPIEPELGAFTVVLSPGAFADLISFTSWMLNAKAVDQGISFASGKIGQKVFGDNLTITDDVTNPELFPMYFDMEGNPTQVLPLIKNGVIENVVYNNKYAAKAGVKTTGHAMGANAAGPANIVVAAGDGTYATVADIIKDTPNGIFINEFHYTNFVNPRELQITGLTRNGTFRIQNGEITKPLSTLRFTESLLNAFKNITAISEDRAVVSGSLVPAVRIEGFHFTSKA